MTNPNGRPFNEESFRRSWRDMQAGRTYPVSKLWNDIEIRGGAGNRGYYAFLWATSLLMGLALRGLMLCGAAYGLALRGWRAVRAAALPEWKHWQ